MRHWIGAGWGRCVAVVTCLGIAATAAAQKKDESGPSKGGGLPSSVKFERRECALAEKEVSGLLELYGDYGNWKKLQDALKAKIQDCTKQADQPGSKASSEAPYLVTMVTPARNVSVVVPQDDRYNPNMPGGPKSGSVAPTPTITTTISADDPCIRMHSPYAIASLNANPANPTQR